MPDPLPTRQLNVLRILLEKSELTPEDVAHLNYRRLLKSPGIGNKGIEIIRRWLAQYQLDLHGQPVDDHHRHAALSNKRVQQAIRLLEKHGFAVSRPHQNNN